MSQPPYPPYPAAPTPPRRWPRRHPIWTSLLGVIGAFVVLIVVIAIVQGPQPTQTAGSPTSDATSTAAASTSVSPSTVPTTTAATTTAKPSPAAPSPSVTTVVSISASPSPVPGPTHVVTRVVTRTVVKYRTITAKATTPPPPPGPVTLLTDSGNGIKNTVPFHATKAWVLHYTYDCSTAGGSGNFIVDAVDASGGVFDSLVNALSAGGSNTSNDYSTGDLHLEINSECDWTVKVTQ